jgi:REP element-mobilizing transposase RayT
MARPLRLEFPGAVYHITARGNCRNAIFIDDADRHRFLSILSNTAERYNWVCHAYSLMDNHYHLLIETPDPTLSIGMRQLNGVYTQFFNRNHNQVGHVFQGRFKSIIVEKNTHLLELCRYIVLNPIRAGIVNAPEQWQWSSYNSTVQKNKHVGFLAVDWLLGQFSRKTGTARERYKSFVMDGLNKKTSPWDELQGQVFLGSKGFVRKIQDIIGLKETVKEIPKEQRFPSRPALVYLFEAGMTKKQRNPRILEAHLRFGYSLKEIGDHLGLHYSTVSRVIKMGRDEKWLFKT